MKPHSTYDPLRSPLDSIWGSASSLPFFDAWGYDIPTWTGTHPSAPQLSDDDLWRMASAQANSIYGGQPDSGQVEYTYKKLAEQYRDMLGNTYGGLLVQPELSGQDISSRIGTMRENYGYDPNYIRGMLPRGAEDYFRGAKDGDIWKGMNDGAMAEGLGVSNNYSLGPVDETNYMFLGSRGARPEDNPDSALYKANQAIQSLGGAAPTYGGFDGSNPISYVVPTMRELETAANKGGDSALIRTDQWASEQARKKMEESLAQIRHQTENQFVQWANFNRADPTVKELFGDWGWNAVEWNNNVANWFHNNYDNPLVEQVIGPNQVRGLLSPQKYLTDPSWGVLGQAGRETLQSDTPGLLASRQENATRQQQAYNSIGDGQFGGVLNQQSYSNPAFRQITGQQPQANGFSSFGTFGGLGGLGGAPTFGANQLFNGTTFNPNPWSTDSNQSQSPWGGPWGGR